jgi:uncharacterized protein (DUF1697 family)
MALVVFLRGVNVGGHRTFRPNVLARELSEYDVVNVGAAGTFIVRKPQSRAKFRTALLPKLPFEADVMLCDGRDLLRLETANPFGTQPSPPDVVRFVSILSKAGAVRASLPVSFPSDGQWLVRVMASGGKFVFGMYRRHMKTIGYLGQIDKLYGAPATTRNWNRIAAILRILKGHSNPVTGMVDKDAFESEIRGLLQGSGKRGNNQSRSFLAQVMAVRVNERNRDVTTLSNFSADRVLPQSWNQEAGVPTMLFERFPKLRGQHGFFLPRFDPIAQDDQANPHEASPLINRQRSADRA